MNATRAWLERLGEGAVAEVQLAFVAGQQVELDEAQLHAARRRALLLLAAGGDPHRDLEPDGRAVAALASDLDSASRREELLAGLHSLRTEAAGLSRAARCLDELLADPPRAWRALACALLADELGDEDQ